jgi:hypothetical protein
MRNTIVRMIEALGQLHQPTFNKVSPHHKVTQAPRFQI